MRGALASNVRRVQSSYNLPSMTGIATLVLENAQAEVPTAAAERHRARMAEQLAGIERLPGTYPYDIATGVKAYRLNKYLHGMVRPEQRERFLADAEASFDAAGLTDDERDLVRRRDWSGLIHYGVIFFMLEKLGAVVGVSNLDIYAAMRGETLEQFLETRNTKLLYSVSGQPGTQEERGFA
jgi:gallate dioxygenase